ncbi:MAG: hypothetical protein JW748_04375 [Anaerolineales bacterium]|nr:hypothetical protein [Anaerolineales bacterium]
MRTDDQADWDAGAPRRILGMKLWQVGLLGGMAALDCLVLVVGAVIILGSIPSTPGGGLVAGAPATFTPVVSPMGAAVAPSPSITPITMAFQFPTYTPYGTPAETYTPTPSVTSMMEGWVKFSVPEIEIWMPGSYAAGNPQTETDAIIASLKEKGANFNWDVIKEQLESVTDNYVMWAIDSYQGNPDVVTNIAFVYDVPNPGEPLGDYATRFVGAMSDSFRLVEQSSSRHPEYEAVLVLLEAMDTTATKTQIALYALKHKALVWDIMCFTAADEMSERLPDFDRMVETFRVLQAP